MFSACMQEVNLKNFIIFHLFYVHFCFAPKFAKEIPASKFVELWLGMVVSETSAYYAHISYFRHNTSLNTFLFTLLTVYTRHFGCVIIMNQDRPTSVWCCSSLLTASFQVYISPLSTVSRKEQLKQRYFSGSFKNALEFCCLNKNEFMNVLNFKFLFFTFPAEAPILLREVQLSSLKSFRDLLWCGSIESVFYPHIVLHYTFGTSPKLFWSRPWLNIKDIIFAWWVE